MIVDVHNHIHPKEWVEPQLKGAKEVTLIEKGIPSATVRPSFYQIDERIEGMDRAGIDMTFLHMQNTWKRSLDDCRLVNNYVGSAVKKYPKRLQGAAHIPLPGDGNSLGELRRCVEDLGLKAVAIESSLGDVPLDSQKLWPFYQYISLKELPVLVHPAQVADYKHCLDYDLSRLLGREIDLMLGVARMIYGGIFDEFPDLKIIFAHLGGGISGLKGRLKATQPWAQHSDHMKQSFDTYFSKIYFDTAGFFMSTDEIKCALIGISPDRLLFGSDYPADYIDYEGVRKFKDMVLAIPMKEQDKAKVMGGNAARLLKL